MEFLIISLAIFLGFFIQTTTGFGAALLSLPLLLTVLDFRDAIGYISIFLLVFSLVMIPKNWRSINKKLFWPLVLGSTIGLSLGIWILKLGNPLILKKLLASFIIFYVIDHYLRKGKLKLSSHLSPLFGLAGGLFSGLFSSGGPVFVAYIHSQLSSPVFVRGTVIGVLAVNNLLRAPLLLQNGILTQELFKDSFRSFPAFIIALILGQIFYSKVNKKILGHIIMILLLVMGLFLLAE